MTILIGEIRAVDMETINLSYLAIWQLVPIIVVNFDSGSFYGAANRPGVFEKVFRCCISYDTGFSGQGEPPCIMCSTDETSYFRRIASGSFRSRVNIVGTIKL